MIHVTNTNYDGIEFCSSILKNNIFATQFHPEKVQTKEYLFIKKLGLINNLL
jgi:glutamine amidotransferase